MRMKDARHIADDIAVKILRENLLRVSVECLQFGTLETQLVEKEYRHIIDHLEGHGYALSGQQAWLPRTRVAKY